MGREIRRVPLDFDWPLDKVWEGFLQPDRLLEDRCPDCRRGYTWAREWVETLTNRIDMLASDVGDQDRGRPMHPWLAQDQYPATTDFEYDEHRNLVATPQVALHARVTPAWRSTKASAPKPKRGSPPNHRRATAGSCGKP